MFWSSAGTSSNIEEILNEPGVTLNKVLEQEEILQELRALNKKLVEFLSKPESLNGMVDLITLEPSSELPLSSQYKLPNVACEVLTSDNSFIEKVTGDKLYLEKMFWFFRDKPCPINPLLASYVCRVLSEIITRKLDQNWYSYQLNLIQIMGYLQSEAGVLSWLLNHLDCSAVCEFFFKLMINVEGQDMRCSSYEWLVDKERIILRIMEKMTRHELEEVHANVSRLIGDLLYAFQDEMINSSQDRSTDCDPFLLALRSHETITCLLNTLFTPDAICETSIMHGLDLILSLLGVTRRSPRQSGRNDALDENNEGIILSEAVKAEVLGRMPTLLNLLQSPVDPNPLPMTYGLLEKPVGLGRLAIAKFIAHLFTLNDDELNMGMIHSGVLSQLLELFWTNPWNNFLHRYVCKIMTCIAKSAQLSPGSASYLLEVGVFSKILEVFENKELKCGFRGHLAKVASAWGEAAATETEGPNIVKDLMDKLEETDKEFYTKWDIFYSDTLENYLTSEKVLLAGVHPPASGGLLSSGGGSGAMPYSETDASSFSTGSGAMQWLGFTAAAAQSMLNVDFDTMGADALLNLSIGGAGRGLCDDDDDDDSPATKAKSLFEMFCNEKSNSFDEDEDEEEDEDEDSTNRKKNSFDLSSPDSDSLDEEKWTDGHHLPKVNFDVNLFNSSTGGVEEEDIGSPGEDDIFSLPPSTTMMTEGDDIKVGAAAAAASSPPISIPSVLGEDPWSNLETTTSHNNNINNSSNPPPLGDDDEDPWGNPDLLFNSAAASGALEQQQESTGITLTNTATANAATTEDAITSSDWANFDKIIPSSDTKSEEENDPPPPVPPTAPPPDDDDHRIGDDEEWANFESAAFPTEDKEKEEREHKKVEEPPSSSPPPIVVSNGNDNSNNQSGGGGSNTTDDVVVDVDANLNDTDVPNPNDELQEKKFQSPTAKDETVSSSSSASQQEVSATN